MTTLISLVTIARTLMQWSGEVEILGTVLKWEIKHWQHLDADRRMAQALGRPMSHGTWNIYVTFPKTWFDGHSTAEYDYQEALPSELGECTYVTHDDDGNVTLGVDFAHSCDDAYYSLEEMLKKLDEGFRNYKPELPFAIQPASW